MIMSKDDVMHVMKQVAMRMGKPVAEVMEMPTEEVRPYLDELAQQAGAALRDHLRQSLPMQRIAGMIARSGMPKHMTIEDGIAAGYLSEDDLIAATIVTEEDIDRAVAEEGTET